MNSQPPAVIGGLQRQPDCSLTYFEFSYASDSSAIIVTPRAIVPHYEKVLHDEASLGAALDRSLAGCVDPGQGISSRPFLFLGPGKNGRELVAVPGSSGVVTSGLKSDGTYTQPATQATPIPCVSLLSGDLNRDGNPDLISINSDGHRSSVTVFLGNDGGTYQPGVDYELPGAQSQYAVLDDLNGDGILDLLVSLDSPAFAFSIFFGNGDGTFRPPQTFVPSGANLHYNDAFITADVNGDGARDIVTTEGQVFLGSGDGATYTQTPQPTLPPVPSSTINFAPSIVAADFNHDGRLDLATNDGRTIRIYLGNGDGTFAAGQAYPAVANAGLLTATDLDGDGNVDLWSGYAGNGIYAGDVFLPNSALALMGNGDGTFQGVPGLPAADSASMAGASSSPPKPVRNQAQSLVLSAPSPDKVTAIAGQNSPPFNITVSSPSAAAQTVTFACTGLPPLAGCVFSPDPLTLTATLTSANVSVTISTTANTLAVPGRRSFPSFPGTPAQAWVIFGLLAFTVILFCAHRTRAAGLVGACFLLVAVSSLGGCGGGSNSSTTTFNGTPPGTYAVSVTAVGAATVSTPSTLTLTVTQ